MIVFKYKIKNKKNNIKIKIKNIYKTKKIKKKK